jgi:hypothetical protein
LRIPLNDQPPKILKSEEKEDLEKNVAVVHQGVDEIAGQKKKSRWDVLKHPLLILLIGALLTNYFIPIIQKRQAHMAEEAKIKYEMLKDIALLTGKVLANAENVVYLHQKPIRNSDQIITTNKAFNTAFDEFNFNFIRIHYQIRTIFVNADLDRGFADIHKAIKELNDTLDLLHEFPTQEISEGHSERIDRSKRKIEAIKRKLDELSDIMINALS